MYIVLEWNAAVGGGFPWLVTPDIDQAFSAGDDLLNDTADFADRRDRAAVEGTDAVLTSKMIGNVTHARIIEMSGTKVEREWSFDLFEGAQWKIRLSVAEIEAQCDARDDQSAPVAFVQDYVHVPTPPEVRKATLIEAAENIMTMAVAL
jgi:hypothetical protein